MSHSPAAQRNKEPIKEVLEKYIPKDEDLKVLEISSGGGTHVVFFAQHFPKVLWQPSEFDPVLVQSIANYAKSSNTPNVKSPVILDISKEVTDFQEKSFDFMLNINLVHISAFKCAEGLFASAGKLLKANGKLFMYGPFAVDGILSPESNINFDRMLRGQNPEWGIRDIRDLKEEAGKNELCLEAVHEMPANNKILVWKKL